MYNPGTNPVSELLGGAVESLDIPEELFRAAATEYADVGSWLAEHADAGEGWEVYPQAPSCSAPSSSRWGATSTTSTWSVGEASTRARSARRS